MGVMRDKLKCKNCGEMVARESIIHKKSINICQKCNIEAEQYRALIDFLCNVKGEKAPPITDLNHIKTYRNKGITYFEIHYTLYYMYAILGKNSKDYRLSAVPYFYKEAKDHLEKVENIKRTAKKIELEEVVIVVDRVDKKPKVNKTRFIDIESII